MPTLPHIARLAARLQLITTAAMVLLPAVVAVYLVRGVSDPSWITTAFPGLPPATALTPAKSTLALALGAVSLVPMLTALAQMRALFARYRSGEILTYPCALHIRCAGLALIAVAIVQTLLAPLQGLLLTWDNPPGQRVLAVSLTSEALWLALAGLFLVMIGWVMAEAARAAEENAGFV